MNELRARELSIAVGALHNVYTSVWLEAEYMDASSDKLKSFVEASKIQDVIRTLQPLEINQLVITPASIFHIWRWDRLIGRDVFFQCAFECNPFNFGNDSESLTISKDHYLYGLLLGMQVNDKFKWDGDGLCPVDQDVWEIAYVCNPGNHDYPDVDDVRG